MQEVKSLLEKMGSATLLEQPKLGRQVLVKVIVIFDALIERIPDDGQ